jgi:hypothetical protein
MKTFHIDEPREIGKKRLKVSPKDIMGVKKALSDGIVENKLQEFVNKPKVKKALQQLVKKNLIPKVYATNMRKLQTFLTNNPMVMTQLIRLLGENINENNKAELYKMYAKAMKMMPGTSKQKQLIKKIGALRKKLKMNASV